MRQLQPDLLIKENILKYLFPVRARTGVKAAPRRSVVVFIASAKTARAVRLGSMTKLLCDNCSKKQGLVQIHLIITKKIET